VSLPNAPKTFTVVFANTPLMLIVSSPSRPRIVIVETCALSNSAVYAGRLPVPASAPVPGTSLPTSTLTLTIEPLRAIVITSSLSEPAAPPRISSVRATGSCTA
jgi:hypothetical protein